MFWLLIVIAGHFSNALAFVVDKILLAKQLKYPAVYVFYIGSLGLLGFVLFPFGGFSFLSPELTFFAFLAGATFMMALLTFFTALKRGEATRVVPFVGGLVPVWTLGFAGLILAEWLSSEQLLGIGILVIGAVFISYERTKSLTSLTWREAFLIVLSAGFFALSFTLTKLVFNQTEFINGFLWMRLFAFLSVLPLLLMPTTRRQVIGGEGNQPPALFYVGQAFGALGFILLNWGIELAPSVSIVNALQGIQYAFLFVFVVIVMKIFPGLIREKLTPGILLQKILAIIILGIGLVLVA